jgi:integrase
MMPYVYDLTWHDARKCWKKHHNGRTYYVGKGACRGKTDRPGYLQAISQWREIERVLSPVKPDPFALPPGLDLSLAARMATDWTRLGVSKPVAVTTAPADRTIEGILRKFVAEQSARARAGEIRVSSYSVFPILLADFRDYCKAAGRTHVHEIDPGLLDAYRRDQKALIGRTDEHALSAYSVRDRLVKVRAFLKWCYRVGAIDCIPRNVDDDFARVGLPGPNPKTFTLDEIRKLWNGASQRTKLYIALGLNCGYRQEDIASLLPEHLDLDARMIRRQRSKTGTAQPHKLWTVTSELLRREMAPRGSAFALLDANGQRLVRVELRDDGGTKRNDPIRLAFDRVMAKLKMADDERRFSTLRKTGATTINRLYPRQPHLASQYLAHDDAATKRFYVEEFYETLFAALDAMEAHFALTL